MGPRRQGSAHHGAIEIGGKGGAEQSGSQEFLQAVADGSQRCWVKLAASTASLSRRFRRRLAIMLYNMLGDSVPDPAMPKRIFTYNPTRPK